MGGAGRLSRSRRRCGEQLHIFPNAAANPRNHHSFPPISAIRYIDCGTAHKVHHLAECDEKIQSRILGLLILVFGVFLLMHPRYANAAGLALYETGAPDMGTAQAGQAALAGDASTAGS